MTASVPQALRAYTVTVAAVGAAAILIATLRPSSGTLSPLLFAGLVLACWLVVVAVLTASLHARSRDARLQAEARTASEKSTNGSGWSNAGANRSLYSSAAPTATTANP